MLDSLLSDALVADTVSFGLLGLDSHVVRKEFEQCSILSEQSRTIDQVFGLWYFEDRDDFASETFIAETRPGSAKNRRRKAGNLEGAIGIGVKHQQNASRQDARTHKYCYNYTRSLFAATVAQEIGIRRNSMAS
jgi:hypothetical protein